MSKKIPVKNTGTNFMHVGGHVIPPGETHLVDEHLVPPKLLAKEEAATTEPPQTPADQPPPPPIDQALLDLVAGTVAQITAQLADLSDDDLVTVQALELDGGNRKGVLEAIEAEKLERATRPPEPEA